MYRRLNRVSPPSSSGRRPQTLQVLLALVMFWLPASTLASATSATPQVARTWQPASVYVQVGRSCVGYSLAAWLDAEPNPLLTHASGWQIYQAANEQDGIAGQHDGTTVAAGVAVLARLGYVRNARSTADIALVLAFLRTSGPIVLEGNFPADPPVLDGVGNLVWAGAMVRHAWLCYGVDAGDRLACQNSESTYWNAREGGRFHMSRLGLSVVLANGQAWLIHKVPPAPSA